MLKDCLIPSDSYLEFILPDNFNPFPEVITQLNRDDTLFFPQI